MKFEAIKSKIQNLGDFKSLAEIKKAGLRVCRNIKTEDYWLIEGEFLKPVIKSPRECKSILVKQGDLKYNVLMVHKSREELKGKKVLDYIEWGEKKKFNKRPTCKNRGKWWQVGILNNEIAYPSTHNPTWFVFFNADKLYMDKVFYGIESDKSKLLVAVLNSFYFLLMAENFGYSLVGGGGSFITVEDLNDLLILNLDVIKKREGALINVFNKISRREMKPIFVECGIDPLKPIREQEPNPLPDRKALDNIVFDAIGLTEQERKEIYWAVCELVQNRLQKAKSV